MEFKMTKIFSTTKTRLIRKEDLIVRALGKLRPKLARELILAAMRTRWFVRHAKGKSSGDFPIAVLKPELAKRIGAKTLVVRLSTETAEKNFKKHKVKSVIYRRVQEFIDAGEVIDVQADRRIGVPGMHDGKHWYAVFKATQAGNEVYLVSLRQTNPKDLARLQRKWVEKRSGGAPLSSTDPKATRLGTDRPHGSHSTTITRPQDPKMQEGVHQICS